MAIKRIDMSKKYKEIKVSDGCHNCDYYRMNHKECDSLISCRGGSQWLGIDDSNMISKNNKRVSKVKFIYDDGTDMNFEIRGSDQIISQFRGTNTVLGLSNMVERQPNGRYVTVLISAPPDILEVLKSSMEAIIKSMIDSH